MSNKYDDDLGVPWVKIILWVCAVGVVLFLANAWGWISFDFWAPKFEETRRTVWEESASHVKGKQQYLTRLYGEWSQADSDHRSALCTVARQETSTINPNHLPESIRDWECVK